MFVTNLISLSHPKMIQLSPTINLIGQFTSTHGTNCNEDTGQEMSIC